MIYLYKKIHNTTGLQYLGQTQKDPFKYTGSGLYWKRHLRVHGNNVTTIILSKCNTMKELRAVGLYYSNLWNIVDDRLWANLKPESGDGGSRKGTNLGRTHSLHTRALISHNNKGKTRKWSRTRSKEENIHLSNILSGRQRSAKSILQQKETKRLNPHYHSAATKLQLSVPKSIETVKNMTLAQINRHKNNTYMWITDGYNNKRININGNILPAWFPGRTTSQLPPVQTGKHWINNGIKNSMSDSLPAGWSYGKIRKAMNE